MSCLGEVWRKTTFKGTSFKKMPWLTRTLPVMIRILGKHGEAESLYFFYQTGINGGNEKFSEEIHVH